MKKICLLFFACVALSGCGIPLIQDAPEDVPRAKLRVIMDDGRIMTGYSQGQSEGVVISYSYASRKLRGRSLGMPNPERINNHSFTEIYIEAGKPFTLIFDYWMGRSSCSIRGSFVPEEGQNYEAQAQLLRKARLCVMGFSVLKNEHWIPVLVNKPDAPDR